MLTTTCLSRRLPLDVSQSVLAVQRAWLNLFYPLIFLAHSDISRYAVPLLPFAFIAFSEIIERREFNLAVLLMSPAVMLYAINFMDHNHGI